MFEITLFLSCLNYLWTKWQYYRPHYEGRNVVPYHCTTLILRGAHMNIQPITPSYWSYYLLKYVMKCEPWGTIKLEFVSATSLGLVDATYLQFQLILTTITTKLVSPIETAFSCLQMPIIPKKCWCKVCWFKLLNLRTKMVTKSRILGFHPIDIYYVWPSNMAQCTFTKYRKQFSPQQ